MNTLIITEAELIIKGDATVQLRISAVLLRKPGRWDATYAAMAHIQKIEHKKPQSLVGRLPGLWLLRFYLEEHRFKYTSESLL